MRKKNDKAEKQHYRKKDEGSTNKDRSSPGLMMVASSSRLRWVPKHIYTKTERRSSERGEHQQRGGGGGGATRTAAAEGGAWQEEGEEFVLSTLVERGHGPCLVRHHWFAGGGDMLDLLKIGRYRTEEEAFPPAKYDDKSCFVMRARYNCANTPNGDLAARSRLMLVRMRRKKGEHQRLTRRSTRLRMAMVTPRQKTRRHQSEVTCDLRSFVDDFDGPKGVARHVLSTGTKNDGTTVMGTMTQMAAPRRGK